MTTAALVLGAGSGARLRESAGALLPPKAFVRLGGQTLLARSIDALLASGAVDLVQPVLPADDLARWPEIARELADAARVAAPVVGGATRQASARAGLAALPAHVLLVAVHDAARPLVAPADVARVIATAREHGAALLAAPLRDTIHRIANGAIAATPAREEHVAAQTPQVFRVSLLREALDKAERDGIVATDDAALVARLGVAVRVVMSSADNLKITTAADLAIAERLLAVRP
ncbi:MAG: 2-C-methyl-D-erythritol 4-phosphate cytidylyltransferase [Deltaproteobacteria bacterium]|nr:2-C-methyl-D-erythritol 4-phosphate cytidylyltransferase [Deltaproteobacteria bacterium]